MNKTVKILATLTLGAMVSLLGTSLLSACGQKGPLYLAPAAQPTPSAPVTSGG